jgi:transaldolase
MRILLESASVSTLTAALSTGMVDGAFVSAAALDRDAYGVDPSEQIATIAKRVSPPIYAMVAAVVTDELYRLGREVARAVDDVIIVLPCVDDGLHALRQLATEGVRTAASLVTTPVQALLAAKSGAQAVCLAVETLDQAGHDATAVVRDTAALFQRHGVAADVIAVATDAPRLAAESLLAGADAVVVSPTTYRALLQHPLTDRALDQLLSDLSRRPRPRGR